MSEKDKNKENEYDLGTAKKAFVFLEKPVKRPEDAYDLSIAKNVFPVLEKPVPKPKMGI